MLPIFEELMSSVVFRTFLLLLTIWFLKVIWGRRKLYELSFKLPGPTSLPIIGNAIQLRSFNKHYEMIICLEELRKRYGDFCRVWMGPEICVVVSDAEDFECVLMSKATSWKGAPYDVIKTAMDGGLLTLSGNTWKRHRNVINPAYAMKTIKSYMPIHNKYSKFFVKNLEAVCDKGLQDIAVYSLRYWADTICHSLFEWEPEFYKGDNDLLLLMTPRSCKMIYERICKVWLQPSLIYSLTENGKIFNSYKEEYHRFFYGNIKRKVNEYLNLRTASGGKATTQEELLEEPLFGFEDEEINKKGKRLTVFGALSEAVLEGNFTIDEVCAEFSNTINPGMDAGYGQLGSLLLNLAMNKKCQDRLWEEIKENLYDDIDADVTMEMLSRFPYLDMCMKEAMRLFPTGPVQLRKLKSDFFLKSKNITLPKDSSIILNIQMLHQNTKYWTNPKSFIPERFLPEESAKRPHFSYLPFSAGQRNCVGQQFGIHALKTAAIYIFRNYELHSDLKTETLPLKADISIRTALEHTISVTRRNRND